MTAISVAGALLAGNPLLETYKTPHQTIPFDKIKIEHYMPAFEEAMKQHDAEIKAIVENPIRKDQIRNLPAYGGEESKWEKEQLLLPVSFIATNV